MNFQLSLEQRMLRDSAAAALDGAGGRWGFALAEAGMLGILLGEEHGGLGLGAVEASLVAFEAGRVLAAWPVAETLAALPVLAQARPDAVAGVLAGETRLTAAASGRLLSAGGRLRGEIIVPFAEDASFVTAAVEGGRVAVLPMARATPTLATAPLDLAVPNVRLRVDIPEDAQIVADSGFEARLTLLRVAEMAGAARRCFDLAVQYLKDRSQFGRPIGANQALKHMAAENFVRSESIRVALEYASAAHDLSQAKHDDAAASYDAAHSMDVLLAYVPGAARHIAEDAIQIHGGIGATWDFALNAYMRRILRLIAAVGSGEAQRLALAGAPGSACEDAPSGSFSAAAE